VRFSGFTCRDQHGVEHGVPGFGGPQGMIVTEVVIEQVARRSRPADRDRAARIFTAPAGDAVRQPVEDNIIAPLLASWRNRRARGATAAIDAFNAPAR